MAGIRESMYQYITESERLVGLSFTTHVVVKFLDPIKVLIKYGYKNVIRNEIRKISRSGRFYPSEYIVKSVEHNQEPRIIMFEFKYSIVIINAVFEKGFILILKGYVHESSTS
jgi:hypothetical protein